MPTAPRDYTDLFLAPVALRVDHRLQELGALERDQLHELVIVETNREARTATARAQDVVGAVAYLLEMQGWEAGWDPRGIRLSHGSHSLVLGVPDNIRRYVAELEA